MPIDPSKIPSTAVHKRPRVLSKTPEERQAEVEAAWVALGVIPVDWLGRVTADVCIEGTWHQVGERLDWATQRARQVYGDDAVDRELEADREAKALADAICSLPPAGRNEALKALLHDLSEKMGARSRLIGPQISPLERTIQEMSPDARRRALEEYADAPNDPEERGRWLAARAVRRAEKLERLAERMEAAPTVDEWVAVVPDHGKVTPLPRRR